MAPSATETITVPQSVTSNLKALATAGDYKEIAAVSFSEEAETHGTDDHAAASVCTRPLIPSFHLNLCTVLPCAAAANLCAQYPKYLPTWNKSQTYPPLEPFEHHDSGKDADRTYPNLLDSNAVVTHLTPTTGSEIRGVQLSSLTDAGKSQLARLVAERKVVAFRDQDFAAQPIPDALTFGSFFGRHHIHPTSGAPEGHPEVHLVHRSAGDNTADKFFENRTSSVAWHSDVSYEEQPPGTTFLYVLDLPSTGGDTLFANAVEAYERLSDGFKERLHGLQAVHSGIDQVNASLKKGSIKRREPVANVHPIVRTHPVTGEKALYVNPQCKLFSPSYRRNQFLTRGG